MCRLGWPSRTLLRAYIGLCSTKGQRNTIIKVILQFRHTYTLDTRTHVSVHSSLEPQAKTKQNLCDLFINSPGWFTIDHDSP